MPRKNWHLLAVRGLSMSRPGLANIGHLPIGRRLVMDDSLGDLKLADEGLVL